MTIKSEKKVLSIILYTNKDLLSSLYNYTERIINKAKLAILQLCLCFMLKTQGH